MKQKDTSESDSQESWRDYWQRYDDANLERLVEEGRQGNGKELPWVTTNEEHQEIVRTGRGCIAAWRKTHPGKVLELACTDFNSLGQGVEPGSDLRGADLSHASLTECFFDNVDLTGARLMSVGARHDPPPVSWTLQIARKCGRSVPWPSASGGRSRTSTRQRRCG